MTFLHIDFLVNCLPVNLEFDNRLFMLYDKFRDLRLFKLPWTLFLISPHSKPYVDVRYYHHCCLAKTFSKVLNP